MAIEYYVGTIGPTITVHSAKDLHEAIDQLHTQVIDNIKGPAQAACLRLLEGVMGELEDMEEGE